VTIDGVWIDDRVYWTVRVNWRSRYLATAVIYLLVLWSLPRNGSTLHNMKVKMLEAIVLVQPPMKREENVLGCERHYT
jgi:hypothetical protein